MPLVLILNSKDFDIDLFDISNIIRIIYVNIGLAAAAAAGISDATMAVCDKIAGVDGLDSENVPVNVLTVRRPLPLDSGPSVRVGLHRCAWNPTMAVKLAL